MDRKLLIGKLSGVFKSGKLWGLVAVGATALTLGVYAGPKASKAFAHAMHALLETYGGAFVSAQAKVDAIRDIDLENERLRLEASHLRLKLESLQFDCGAKEASGKTRAIEYKLDQQTGSATGRDLASIAYRVPSHLTPEQAYTLGISYFKAREDEKAAVIFTFLSGLDGEDTYKTPKNFLLTGIAWYRLDNFAVADRYFDRVLRAPAAPENLPHQAQARLWKGLVAQRVGKHAKSQFWLTELIDHHPRSEEAAWVNRPGGARGLSSED